MNNKNQERIDYNQAVNTETGNHCDDALKAFDETEAAPKWEVVPSGTYTVSVIKGELTKDRKGADIYRMQFQIIDGPHQGKRLFRTWWFTSKTLPYTKRDLAEFGLNTVAQLRSPFPSNGQRITARVVVVLRINDDGTEWNDVKRIDNIQTSASRYAKYLADGATKERNQ